MTLISYDPHISHDNQLPKFTQLLLNKYNMASPTGSQNQTKSNSAKIKQSLAVWNQ